MIRKYRLETWSRSSKSVNWRHVERSWFSLTHSSTSVVLKTLDPWALFMMLTKSMISTPCSEGRVGSPSNFPKLLRVPMIVQETKQLQPWKMYPRDSISWWKFELRSALLHRTKLIFAKKFFVNALHASDDALIHWLLNGSDIWRQVKHFDLRVNLLIQCFSRRMTRRIIEYEQKFLVFSRFMFFQWWDEKIFVPVNENSTWNSVRKFGNVLKFKMQSFWTSYCSSKHFPVPGTPRANY